MNLCLRRRSESYTLSYIVYLACSFSLLWVLQWIFHLQRLSGELCFSRSIRRAASRSAVKHIRAHYGTWKSNKNKTDSGSLRTVRNDVRVEDQLVGDDAASRDKQLDAAAVLDVVQRVDAHKHHRGVSL